MSYCARDLKTLCTHTQAELKADQGICFKCLSAKLSVAEEKLRRSDKQIKELKEKHTKYINVITLLVDVTHEEAERIFQNYLKKGEI